MKTTDKFIYFQIAVLFAILLLPFGLIFTQKTYASSNDNLQLQILPLDCVFEIVNDGLNTVHYVTPEKCAQELPQQSNPSNPQPSQNYPIGSLFQSSSKPGQTSTQSNPQKTLGEFASIKQSKTNNTGATIAKGLGVATILAVTIAMAISFAL